MAGEITLQPQFQLLKLTAGELAHQATDGLRQLQMRLQPLHDLSAQARDVDGAAGRQPQQHIADLLRHINGHIFLSLLGGSPQVRGEHQAALHRPQRRILRQWFARIHIQTGPGNHTVVDGLRDGRFIHHTTAGTVHDPRRGFHRAQQLRIHQVLGVLGAGDVQGHVIRRTEQLIQLGESHLHLLGAIGGDEGVIGDHLHTHGPGNAGDMGADLAQPHDAKGLFVELVADVFLTVPFAVPHARVGLGHVPRQGQHHRQGMLCRRDRVALRRIHDQHTALGGSRHIHVVHADSGAADDLELRCSRDHLSGHLRA